MTVILINGNNKKIAKNQYNLKRYRQKNNAKTNNNNIKFD